MEACTKRAVKVPRHAHTHIHKIKIKKPPSNKKKQLFASQTGTPIWPKMPRSDLYRLPNFQRLQAIDNLKSQGGKSQKMKRKPKQPKGKFIK